MGSCNYCRKKKFEIVAKVKDREIIKCSSCGLITVWPIPADDVVKNLINDTNSNFIKEYLAEQESYKEYFKEKVADIVTYHKTGRLLDVGCGPGMFIEISQSKGFKSWGLDISAEAIRISRKKGLSTKLGKLEVLKPRSEFDVVTVFQTLEHVPNPQSFLNHCFKVLKNNGILVITTPDQRGLISSLMGRYWFEYYNLEHFYFFTTKTLNKLLRRAGFEVEFCRVENGRKITLNYILRRLTDYYYTEKTFLSKLINLLKGILNIVGNFSIREPKVNIYVIAKKTGKAAGI